MSPKIFFLILILGSNAFAQLDDQSYLTEYKKAVQYFADGQYELATQKLNPLCNKTYVNAVVPYSYFYNALANSSKGNKYQSRVLLRQLFENYYDWDQINEARLLYIDLNLAENYFEEGLKNIELILEPSFKPITNGMLENYIPKIQSQSTLKDLYLKFPTQKILAKYLVKKIQSNKYNSKEDLELSDQLTNSFKFKDEDFDNGLSKRKPPVAVKNTTKLNFAVLLPFELNMANGKAIKSSNQYVYDLYFGMKMAAETLEKEGLKIGVNAFDVKKQKNDFVKYSSTGALKGYDVFIGPLYAEPNTEAINFAAENKIIQIHPLSNNINLVADKPNVFLAQPSYAQQARKALDYMTNVNNKKSVSIYYGIAKKDSLFAEIYKAEAKIKGYKISSFRKYNLNQTLLNKDDGHIFLAADNNLGVRFIQLMNRTNVNSELIMTASAINWEILDKSLLTNNISLIYPEFVDEKKPSVINFNKIYNAKMANKPSYYNYLGYDLVYYYSKMLNDGFDLFKINLSSINPSDNYLLSGFDYSQSKNENEVVPIIKYVGNNFEEIYR